MDAFQICHLDMLKHYIGILRNINKTRQDYLADLKSRHHKLSHIKALPVGLRHRREIKTSNKEERGKLQVLKVVINKNEYENEDCYVHPDLEEELQQENVMVLKKFDTLLEDVRTVNKKVPRIIFKNSVNTRMNLILIFSNFSHFFI